MPELYAALTMADPPVARMAATSLWRINSSVASMVGCSMQLTTPSGAPALTAASFMSFAAAAVHFVARGCGLNTMAFLAFNEMMALNIAVDVGLVVGTSPASTPTGTATSYTLFTWSSWMNPTVRISRMASHTVRVANSFLMILSS
ncbi:MAG: hypothetical protein BWY85_01787 [Firmicutes bacterium ADurb.Bin506]|nr:MAG: hypothetical protein BWY85_01787 [Firmicutes bacterium ADurb.Bin506]